MQKAVSEEITTAIKKCLAGSLSLFGYHFIISLVTGKNINEINALMKKASYDNILHLI